MIFDTGKFLRDVFKNSDTASALLQRWGYQIEKTTVYQWFYRDAIPGKWALVLLALHESETGQKISLIPYVR